MRPSIRACIAMIAFFPSAAAGQQAGQQQMDDFSLSGFSDKGKKNWNLTGQSADISAQLIRLTNIQSLLHGEDNESVKVTADSGDFDRQTSVLQLQDNVVVTTSTGVKLETDSLQWDRKEQRFSTPDQVRIDKQDMRITGQGATGEPQLSRVELARDVRVQISGEEPARPQQKITIECEGPMQVDYKANKAVFSVDVRVTTGDGDMSSDMMDVYFTRSQKDGSAAKIDRIVARGNVRILRDGNVSLSDEAVYSGTDRKITLTGKPKLVIYSTEGLDAPFGD